MTDLVRAFRQHRLVAILRGVPPRHAPTLARTLYDAGIRLLEVALSDEHGLASLAAIAASKPRDLELGAGTVLTPDVAGRARERGATFLVTPHVVPHVNEYARAHDLGLLCGAMTPTEIAAARAGGSHVVKLFPAGPLGVAYLESLFGPYPDLDLIVVGGIDERNITSFLRAGALGAGVGGALTRTDWERPDFESLAERARTLVNLASNRS